MLIFPPEQGDVSRRDSRITKTDATDQGPWLARLGHRRSIGASLPTFGISSLPGRHVEAAG